MSVDTSTPNGKAPSVVFRTSTYRTSLSTRSLDLERVKESRMTITSKFISDVRRSLNNATLFKSSNKRRYTNELAKWVHVCFIYSFKI